MIKRTLAMFAIASTVVLAVSCKENAALRIDDEAVKRAEIAHAEAGKIAVMKFGETEFDFGDINSGDVVEHTFTFTNEGTSDLIISKAKASCGCTVPSYTKTPVAPGGTGEVKVSFNSSGKSGNQKKSVTVTANTEKGSEILKFSAEVAPKPGTVNKTKKK
ncbi:MAG: hypothetical protein BM557_07550 [Flavobacterium sp. MedPE-SWcel]|uniref:DUF1573 domain-containing protein n=1 Tax=uncultured Flavobacterium sp. TaxID=165435 RepID=UPI00091EA22D|nr:DUF1573 domain-containing protein [uncultured Flavobacterium sp.]OIQ18063.1 MAG: hypothetical protein BM557_07550 [Flavobacterium sp. MedPE-SWcel]